MATIYFIPLCRLVFVNLSKIKVSTKQKCNIIMIISRSEAEAALLWQEITTFTSFDFEKGERETAFVFSKYTGYDPRNKANFRTTFCSLPIKSIMINFPVYRCQLFDQDH